VTRIIQGVLNFQKRVFGSKQQQFEDLAKGQKPLALFITCSDSRVMPDLLAQTEPGELFILRNAGNLVPPHGAGSGAEAATVEYAVAQLKVRDVIVCGHSRCGAMHGLLEPAGLAKLPSVAAWVEYAKAILPEVQAAGEVTEDRKLELAVERNVLLQMEHLKTHPAVKEAMEARTVRLHGWVYHFEVGKVDVYDPLAGKFIPVEQRMSESWKAARQDASPRTEWETRL
jgi:carbonic anhydrase